MANRNGKQRAEGNSSAEEFDEEEQSYEEWAFQQIDAYYDAAIEEEKERWRLLHASQDSAAAVEDDGFVDGESDEEFSYIDPMIAPPVNGTILFIIHFKYFYSRLPLIFLLLPTGVAGPSNAPQPQSRPWVSNLSREDLLRLL